MSIPKCCIRQASDQAALPSRNLFTLVPLRVAHVLLCPPKVWVAGNAVQQADAMQCTALRRTSRPTESRRPSQAASLPTPPPVPMGLHAFWTSALPVANVRGFILTVVVTGLSGANDK